MRVVVVIKDKAYCIIDHANKLGDGREFDPYQYWLDQAKRRKEIEALARKNEDRVAVTRNKSRLT
jgi:hypothetical protein